MKMLNITKETVLKVLKEVYSQGDSYQCGEDDKSAWASFSNDYPMQHGDGWVLEVYKDSGRFVTRFGGNVYRINIQRAIQKYCITVTNKKRWYQFRKNN